MSTRVQKGNAVFRPVAKPRARVGSEARQTPQVLEHRASAPPAQGIAANATPGTSMPPPSNIPQKPPSLTWVSSDNHASRPVSPPVAPKPTQPPQIATAVAMPSRNAARPPAVQAFPPRPPVPSAYQEITRQVPDAFIMPFSDDDGLASTALTDISQALPPPIASSSDGRSQGPPPFSLDPTTDFTSAAISDAQIDPALLQAVVTALRHAEESQLAHLDEAATDELRDALRGDHTTKASAQRRHSARLQAEGGDENAVEHPKRTRRRRTSTAVEADTLSQPVRRKRSAATSADVVDGEDGGAQPRHKRTRRSRAHSLPPYDLDADPGEEIDPIAVTMAELCDDIGRGRVSSKAAQIMDNHAAWRQANREKRARQRAITEAKKYGRNLEEEENASSATDPSTGNTGTNTDEIDPSSAADSSAAEPSAEAENGGADGQKGDDYDYTKAMSTSRYNVQVRVGPNGETIIDETSLFVDRQEEDETANYTHIEESDTTKFVNSSTYSRKLRGSRWSAEETELFYDALQQFGENYELISYVLPGRDRKACKNKFRAEDRRNPNRITWCLKNRRPYDMQTLSRMTGKDFSGPTPVIKAPTPPSLDVRSTSSNEEQLSTEVKKQTGAESDGEEIIGSIEDTLPSS
ncbi:uncharacterized protein PHACADRAFT_204514 [Phanerochaete carnosa HHB-10118-sp]|uniref:Uncharacterized protein n=1 Tax=Phanerochaete carnosa (strain HHB-10118-sp) TaxID=650164 RepID=K5VEE0_PHACS|nr:uncharacterized protein PHACADRAFT_204514 [Phanerochaete carnosa HHB-10118-sp]EKM61346.1 hypothetical protein PHACADRAFT_204514 [Phanerochaete carnosa HHB-10118-sp]